MGSVRAVPEVDAEDMLQRVLRPQELFSGMYFLGPGCGWRMLRNDLPPWTAVHQQTQRWMKHRLL
jgi:transposase